MGSTEILNGHAVVRTGPQSQPALPTRPSRPAKVSSQPVTLASCVSQTITSSVAIRQNVPLTSAVTSISWTAGLVYVFVQTLTPASAKMTGNGKSVLSTFAVTHTRDAVTAT